MKNVNPQQSISDNVFQLLREKEVWKELSGDSDFPWNNDVIEKYADKLDWAELCQNSGIYWNSNLIEKHKHKIDWAILSENIINIRYQGNMNSDWSVIRKFKNDWDWQKLSVNIAGITEEILDEFSEFWDWSKIINNYDITWSYNMYEKHKNNFTITNLQDFQDSKLFKRIIELDTQILIAKILQEK